MKIIIIGGVAAGMSAASKIRRMDPNMEVTVYEKGGFLSYGACGLPYYVGDYNDDYRKMIARSRETFTKMGIKTFLRHQVLSVDADRKEVLVRNLENGQEWKDRYDKLMIATGASSVVPPFPGRELLGVHVLKSMEDGIFLKEYAKMPEIQNVVIVGGGYIGVECAEAFLSLGKKVRILEAAPRILTPFDEEITALAQEELVRCGIELNLGEKVEGFYGDGLYVKRVKTDRGTYEADLVIVAVGVRPCTEFLKDTGISMAKNGALIVDREMKTSLPDVYAAGDCILVHHEVLEEDSFLALGTVANKCGRIAGTNLAGGHEQFLGALGSAAIKVCGLELGRTGMGEGDAKRLQKDYKTLIVQANDHPAYYPDPTPITIKLIYEKGTKRLLGAQTCGQKGAVLRADVFAVAIHCRMTTAELGMTDLIYAPPFSGVWDAIQIACNAAKG
ncbi:CoA-disulfide reductase [Lacrimispora saccharolytica]|uniref:FAD-dependent pyridine nucleotide-disulfide oxidoreductase n=1 Tax=Lacrimispora saccharolytica (strain ATCC 35040 / DSM 2544 / NRCC 2533 / WM1) TaxID=610130 RepID=D9QZF9_LACSW|nr:CoA-disulfide reductase [Lacrimispora saccharolytica]ADL04410.1 FAD-dependent pyridine nucleotide-disulfide oxidoreductase [[Clostridium] saccharolyticum WM1]QRV21324.1 CoA-disulfide reductase [Lacrimispora saccharolytica]